MIGEKTKGTWIEVENPAITEFYNKLYEFIRKHYLMSLFNRYNEVDTKGENSNWLQLSNKKIGLFGKGIQIIIKFNQQETGIEFSGMANRIDEMKEKLEPVLSKMFDDGALLEKRGKSASLFYMLKPVDVTKPFETQEENVNDALLKTQKLLYCFWELRDKFNITKSPF